MVSPPGERILPLKVEKEMKVSYMNYAMSVIQSRALPDLRDGLKPSQRRILYAMHELGLGPRGRFRKCAKIAGDTSGNYHPHGEAVVYPTLVRMAQPFSLRNPLVDGQGNFGSIDGDGPAAMRYTEARMTGIAVEMLEDIKKDTVDYQANYDNTLQEPIFLPAKFPNLLCNGSDGIAVGMATSLAPHNLVEVCDAIEALLADPEITIEELLGLVPAPDFPTGGVICGRKGVHQAAHTGRGIVVLRATYEIIDAVKGKPAEIVFTEIPYQVKKESIKDKIRDAYNDGRLPGLHDVRDYSDRHGIRLTTVLKRGEDPEILLNQLFKHTPLQNSYSIINLVIDRGKPRTLNLKQLLEAYRDSRFDVLRRRTQFELDQAEARIHILRGLHIAVQNIDEVVRIIRASSDEAEARQRLEERFELSQRQSKAIVDMRLGRLTALEIHKLEEEIAKLEAEITDLKDILARDERVYEMISADVQELKRKYGNARRSTIDDDFAEFVIEDLIPDEMMAVTVSREGYIKRTALNVYRSQGRGGRGVTGADTKEGDQIRDFFAALARDLLLFFTDKGRCYWRKVYELPEMARTTRGRAIANVLQLEEDENLQLIMPVRDFDDRTVVFATRQGRIKKTALKAYSRPRSIGIRAIDLLPDDRLIGVNLCEAGQEIMLATSAGQTIRFSEADVRQMGRVARGVRGIDLREGDFVVALVVASTEDQVLTICEAGYGKRTAVGEYRKTRRGGKGVISIRTTQRNGPVVVALVAREEQDVMLVTRRGMIVRIPVDSISSQGRGTQGVKLIDLKSDDCVVSARGVAKDEELE